MTKKTLTLFIIAATVLLQPGVSSAQSDYEFYFFGVNVKTFYNSNWLMVAMGAATSVLAHELGHALYLESQGKDWNLVSSTSGLAIHTGNYLTASQDRNLGRSGFAFQAGIGAVLTAFESTKHLDFTKGWVSMNAAQFFSYKQRQHDIADDFALIERGDGDSDLDFGTLALIGQSNLLAIESPVAILSDVPGAEEKRKTTSPWHVEATFGPEQAGQRAWALPKEIKPNRKQAGENHIDYATLRR